MPPYGAGDIFLTPPPPVRVVKDEDAATAVPLDTAKQLELCQKARAFTAETTALDGNWPAFIQKINSIEDMQASASVSSRMLDRPAAALNGGKGKAGNDAQSRVSNTLVDLRATVTELDPNRADLQGVRKLLKFLPGGDKVERYFATYDSAQSHLNAIIDTEKANMWTTMGKLSEFNELASALDTGQLDVVRPSGRTPVASLQEQLESLLGAVSSVLLAAQAQDADAMFTQGNFLGTTFSRSDLDL